MALQHQASSLLVFRPNWAKRPAVAWGTFAVAVGWMVLRNLLERF